MSKPLQPQDAWPLTEEAKELLPDREAKQTQTMTRWGLMDAAPEFEVYHAGRKVATVASFAEAGHILPNAGDTSEVFQVVRRSCSWYNAHGMKADNGTAVTQRRRELDHHRKEAK